MLGKIDINVQPCFVCKKSINGCSWSKNFEPVDGWIAIKVKLDGWRKTETYKIFSCPEFEYDGLCNRCLKNRTSMKSSYFSNYCPYYIGTGFTDCRCFENEFIRNGKKERKPFENKRE